MTKREPSETKPEPTEMAWQLQRGILARPCVCQHPKVDHWHGQCVTRGCNCVKYKEKK